MSLYASPNGLSDAQMPRAPQACMTCRKQKRKCNKALPACALCERMNRHCDYSDSSPPPTSDDFNALRMKLLELESRLNGGNNLMSPPTTFATPSGTNISGSEGYAPHLPVYSPPQDAPWPGIHNRFPAIAFLDGDAFKYGGVEVPKTSVDIPGDVLDFLGDGSSVQAIISDYFATTHRWKPIVSKKRLTRNMANPLWEAGPDLAFLFLSMKLITSRPQDGVSSSQTPVYLSAKRFLSLLEASGTISLLVLQASLLITWYEYGQAIYPAAWMSAGWCVRYGNLLGINRNSPVQLLPRPGTWTEREERRRTWWAVLIVDRLVSLGSQSQILNSQEPLPDDPLPVNDYAWDEGEMGNAIQKYVSSPISESDSPFPRLCQAYVIMGHVFSHHHGEKIRSETARVGLASQLYIDISALARKLTDEVLESQDFLSLAAPLALTYSAVCALCDSYSCPSLENTSPEAAKMQSQAVDGLKTVARSIVDFAEQLEAATPNPQDLDRVSPIIMDALYSAATNYAWLVRESGAEDSQRSLESIRHCMRRLGTRWRSAAEYLRVLEAQEFTYAVGSAGS